MDIAGPISRLTITRGQVASLLGISEATFAKRRPQLEGHGFPRKLPGMATWSRPAVVAWIASNGAPMQPAIAADPVGEARDELARQYA